MKRHIAYAVIMAGIVLLGVGSPAYAADAGTDGRESITMSPTSRHFFTDPGKSINDVITVVNDGTTAYDFSVYARPYSVEGESYQPIFSKITPNTDSYAWVHFSKTNYRLEPGQSKKVAYSLDIPGNAKSGGHYAVLFAETQPPKAKGGTSVVRKKRVGTILYTTVKGDNIVDGRLIEDKIPFLQTNTPLTANSRIANSGNVDFTDTTEIVVSDVFGNKKHSQTRDMVVLPSTTRNISYTWPEASSFGLYKVTLKHSFLGKNSEASSYVLMAPIWLLALIGVAIIGLIVYVATRRRRRK